MTRKYFGTDGMRGEANKDLTIDLVTDLGLALGYYLKKNKKDSVACFLACLFRCPMPPLSHVRQGGLPLRSRRSHGWIFYLGRARKPRPSGRG